MQFRNHPLMRYGSIRNWPPVWISLHEAGEGLPLGEVGVLTEVRKSQFRADRLVLVLILLKNPLFTKIRDEEND